MNYKLIGTIGLVSLLICQIMFTMGFEFLTTQKPIDFAHWSMLLGAVMLIAFSFVFPKGKINTIATALTILGIVAHVGMCTIDFTLWSFATDMDGRNELVGQLMNTPSVWIPFMVAGPPLLYIGLSFHAWAFIKSHTLSALVLIIGALIFGLGEMVLNDRMIVLLGYILFSIGLILLAYRKEVTNTVPNTTNKNSLTPILE